MNPGLRVAQHSAQAAGRDAGLTGPLCKGFQSAPVVPAHARRFSSNTLAVVLEGGLDPRYSVLMREASSAFPLPSMLQAAPVFGRPARSFDIVESVS